MGDLVDDLKLLIRTRHPIVTIQTLDESFAARMVRKAGREMGLFVLEWSVTDMLRHVVPPGGQITNGTDTLIGTLKFMRSSDTTFIYILKDAMRHLADPIAERLLRDVAEDFSRDTRTIFMIDEKDKLPSSLRSSAVPYELALPDEAEILDPVQQLVRPCEDVLQRFHVDVRYIVWLLDAVAGADHLGQERLADGKQTRHVACRRGGPVVGRLLVETAAVAFTSQGTVDQHVQTAETLDHRVAQSENRLEAAQVKRQRIGFVAGGLQLSGELLVAL